MAGAASKAGGAIVTGGSRGLGLEMAFALARSGVSVLSAAHIEDDFAACQARAKAEGLDGKMFWQLADLRNAGDCARIVQRAQEQCGQVDILVNNAGLTLTFVAPDLYTRASPRRFYESSDDVLQSVYATNVVAPEMLAAKVAPDMVARGWGRIINVTTMLSTMERTGFAPYGSSKAALEMASSVWAADLKDTGVTVNILNPGGGANTLGIAAEMRKASSEGRVPKLVEAHEMAAPLLWLTSQAADGVNGWRFDANLWDSAKPAAEAAQAAGRPAGFLLKDKAALPASLPA